jgi:hypothetical protein
VKHHELAFGLVVHDADADLVGRVRMFAGEEVILQRPPGRQWGARAEALKLATEEQKLALGGESLPEGKG